jgi:hypothetical protein
VRVGAWSRGPTWWGCDGGGARYDCGIKPTRPPAPGSHLQAEPAGTAPPYAVEPARFRCGGSTAGRAGCHSDIWRGGQPAILTLGYRAFCRLIDVVLLSAPSAVQQNRDDGGGKTSHHPVCFASTPPPAGGEVCFSKPVNPVNPVYFYSCSYRRSSASIGG